MLSAPSENPAKASNNTVKESTLPPPKSTPKRLVWNNRMNNVLNPNTAKPATPSPMTMPPVKETLRPSLRLVRAACVVRTLAWVAMRMPMLPASAENTAPMTKATTMNQ